MQNVESQISNLKCLISQVISNMHKRVMLFKLQYQQYMIYM